MTDFIPDFSKISQVNKEPEANKSLSNDDVTKSLDALAEEARIKELTAREADKGDELLNKAIEDTIPVLQQNQTRETNPHPVDKIPSQLKAIGQVLRRTSLDSQQFNKSLTEIENILRS